MLFAPLAFVTAPPTAAAATTAFAALAWSVEGRMPRAAPRLRARPGQPDLVLAVVELGEGDETLVAASTTNFEKRENPRSFSLNAGSISCRPA